MTGKLRDKALEVAGAIRTLNHSRQHSVLLEGDDTPCYWQTEEWILWMLELATELEAEALNAAPVAGTADDD